MISYSDPVRWRWGRRDDVTNVVGTLADPTIAALFMPGGVIDIAGISVNEATALGNSALFRGVSLVAGTLAGLPMNSWTGEGTARKKVPSIFDDPDGPDGQTVFEWKETAFVHLILHGRCGALKIFNAAGGLVGLKLVSPLSWSVETPTAEEYEKNALPVGGMWFKMTMTDKTQVRLDATKFWYVPSMSTDGILGRGVINTARQSVATALAGDKAAAKAFSSGALISGLATPEEEGALEPNDLTEIRRQIDNAVTGVDNAGGIALINRVLKFTPWTMTAQQAQFIESRAFQIEEIARWTGVPPHLLMQTDKQTSWGTGVDEQNRGLSKFVLGQWAQRFEQRASRLLARPRWVEFDFAGLERPNFAVEIDLLLKQTGNKPILTVNEARAVRNLPPVDGGNVLLEPAPAHDPNGGTDDPNAQ